MTEPVDLSEARRRLAQVESEVIRLRAERALIDKQFSKQTEQALTLIGELASARIRLAGAKSAIGPLWVWWSFTEAQIELCGEPAIEDSAVVLSFMGSGASTNVTAGQLRALIEACSHG